MNRPPFVLELAQASIVTPVDGSADSCAAQIAHALQAQYDLALPIVCGDQPIKTRHAIALGCLANNPFIEPLYLRWQTLVDRWYPGSGGYVVQTIARAPSIEGCALLLGGSDTQGVAAATAEFLPILSASTNGELPWLLKVKLGTDHKPLPEDRLDALGTSTSLAAGRDPHSGREIVAAGTGSTSVNFIDGETGALQADRLSEYGLPDQIKAYLDPQQERLFFFVGHSWLSCGSTVWAWAADELDQPQRRYCESVDPLGRLTGGWDTCAARDFWLGHWITAENEQLLVLRHGAVNQLTAYDLESAQPLWDVGLGGAPIAMAIVVAETAADARVHVADEYGWWTTFDGSGRKVGAQRIAQRLEGIHAEATGEVFLWNREQLLRGTAEQIDTRYALGARPLGWCQWGEQRGLLGTDGNNILLQKL